jgi:type I restriction enzyme S subunit
MVPDGWKLCAIKDVSTVVTGNTPPTKHSEYYGGEIPFVSPADLGSHKIITDSGKKLTNEGSSIARHIPEGSTLFTCIGSTIGKVGLAGRSLSTNQQINAVIPTRNNDKDYIYYQLLHRSKSIKKLAGTQAVPIINKSTFENQPILIPPLPEQKKIARILSTWDKAIETVDKLIENSKQQKKALMQQLLTGKKRLPGFCGEWKEVRLGDVVSEVKRKVDWDDSAIYKLISVKRRSEGLFLRDELIGYKILTKKMNIAKKGDFLISKMQVVHGATGLVTSKFDGMHISDSYIALNAKKGSTLAIDFLNWLSKTKHFYHLAYLSSYGVHIEKMTFNLKLFLKNKIKIPPTIEEQEHITNILNKKSQQITMLEKYKDRIEKEKQALMQQLITGKRRVTVAE